MTVYSADWVLPVEGEPIRDGAVVVEGARIAAVGTAAELGAGERFESAVWPLPALTAHASRDVEWPAGLDATVNACRRRRRLCASQRTSNVFASSS